jgi:hypothetical protein
MAEGAQPEKKTHGGYREGAGRKKDPLKDIRLGAATALKILRELKHEEALVELYKTCGNASLKASIIFHLREWAYGRPVQMAEIKADVNEHLYVNASERLTRLLNLAVERSGRKPKPERTV